MISFVIWAAVCAVGAALFLAIPLLRVRPGTIPAERGAGVLHYDRHFDTLCRVLGVESVWITEPGSID